MNLATIATLIGVLAMSLLAACAPELPDPESPSAKTYRDRCGTCHYAYAPRSLTSAMWRVQVDRMQEEMLRRNVPPLSDAERDVVLRYVQAHAADVLATATPAGG